MVQLHAVEHGHAQVRATRDIDILAQARPPGTLTALHEKLGSLGFELVGPDLEGPWRTRRAPRGSGLEPRRHVRARSRTWIYRLGSRSSETAESGRN